jgi:hypothetical protein
MPATASYATIDQTEERNERGVLQPCVYAECAETGYVAGPVWGHGEASVKRVLATLTAECSCGAGWHEEE